MEEKTPVGSNAPIEESTEKKTSPAGSSSPSAAPAAGGSASPAPAGSNSPSAAPAGSNSASPASIAETADVVDSASADTGAESAPAGSNSPSATPIAESAGAVDAASTDVSAESTDAGAESADASAEAAPDEEEDENAQWEAYEREQAEIEESRRKPGKYRWVMKQDDMREAMLALEKAKGRYRMYTIAAYVMCVFALFPAADFILTRSAFSMIAAFAAMALGFWIHGITSRAARGAMKQMNPRGIKFSIEAKKHGLQVSDMVNKASLMPYSFFKAAYETEDYLSLVTVKNSALHIKRDEGSASYRALREKLQQELGEHFVSKKIQKNK